MKRIIATISPVLFIYFAGCGGGDSSPPQLPAATTPPQVVCADHALTNTIQKCQSNITPLIPLLLQNNQSGNSGNNTALLTAILSQRGNQPTPVPPVQTDPNCPVPAQPDPNTSCHDDLMTTLLLWKSAHTDPGNTQLAINDPTYRNYLFSKLKFVINSAGAQAGITPGSPQAYSLLGTLGNTFLNSGLLNQSGLPRSQISGIQSLIQNGLGNRLLTSTGGGYPRSNYTGGGLGGFPVGNGNSFGTFSGQQTLDTRKLNELGISTADELKKAKGYGLTVTPTNKP